MRFPVHVTQLTSFKYTIWFFFFSLSLVFIICQSDPYHSQAIDIWKSTRQKQRENPKPQVKVAELFQKENARRLCTLSLVGNQHVARSMCASQVSHHSQSKRMFLHLHSQNEAHSHIGWGVAKVTSSSEYTFPRQRWMIPPLKLADGQIRYQQFCLLLPCCYSSGHSKMQTSGNDVTFSHDTFSFKSSTWLKNIFCQNRQPSEVINGGWAGQLASQAHASLHIHTVC